MRSVRGWIAGRVGVGLTVALFALGIAFASAAEPMDHETAARHRALLHRAERELARGALEEGLTAAGEAVLLADASEDRLALAAARLVRANLLLALGDLPAARDDLERVVAAAEALDATALSLSARLNLANVRVAEGELEAGLALYQGVVAGAEARGDAAIAARARVNALRVQVATGELPTKGVRSAARAAVAALEDDAMRALLSVHLGKTALEALEGGLGARAALLAEGNAALREALVLADRIGREAASTRIRAEALGHLAGLYAVEGRLEEALSLSRRALLQAARGEVGAEVFPWHLQSARLLARAGRRDEALAEYQSSLRVLEAHRSAIQRAQRLAAAGRSDVTDAARLYREYVDLLLRRAREAEGEEARRADLLTAQSILERLKSDELRDYFEDDCVIRYREKIESITKASTNAAIVYPFVLDDRLELLVSSGEELVQVVVDVDRKTLREEVGRFRGLLEKRTTRQYLRPAQTLHGWLVAPIEPLLARLSPRTLVFVPDGILRTIPMAALHDGERFLVERYALGLTPGLELTDPRPFDAEGRRALVAGVSEAVQGFAALPDVEREVASVHDLMGGDQLLNRDFSRADLTQRIRENDFGLIHIASHARFDPTAAGGFMLAHDGPLSFDALADAVAASRFRDAPLDLVILSACETAQGDERAALGLSGVAVKAGARSALGTLWNVSDSATAEFMIRFYASLKEPGTSRAEAVRDGQLRLLRDGRYRHPFYWSPFLLINSWL